MGAWGIDISRVLYLIRVQPASSQKGQECDRWGGLVALEGADRAAPKGAGHSKVCSSAQNRHKQMVVLQSG